MWVLLVRLILRYRLGIIIAIGIITAFMAYNATKVKLSYELSRMLPASDSANVEYDTFKQRFGEDGNVFAIGIKTNKIFELGEFNALYDLCNTIRKYEGIEEVVSITRVLNIYKNDSTKKFEFKPIVKTKPTNKTDVDSLKNVICSLPFYEGLLFNYKTGSYLIAITLDKNKLNNRSRVDLVYNIRNIVEKYRIKHNVEVHYSGLPYIRTVTSQKVKEELKLFVLLSLIIASLILIMFFRSFRVLFSCLIIVVISVIWGLGTIALFNYKITMLTGVIPSLLVIKAIQNCIYLLNKYHWEYKSHGNKVKALSRVVQRIGFATLITNITTAIGFAAFIFTSNALLKEFGVIASMNVMFEYLLSIILIPIIFSYLPPPQPKHILHLDSKFVKTIMSKVKFIVLNKRGMAYIAGSAIILISIYGMTLMRTSGKVVDDIPEKDPIYKDLKFFENNFSGVMPFEISIDTKKKNGVLRLSTIRKIDSLQKVISEFRIFSKPLSLAELVKFSKQSFYNGNEEKYELPDGREAAFIMQYLPSKIKGKKNILHSFIDSTKQYTRISVQMADIGMKEMNLMKSKLRPKTDSIFNPKDFNVTFTGNSIVYTKGTEFLIHNLWESIVIAIILISLLMIFVFSSYRMILIAMFCNLVPLLITAAIMGFTNIPIKPSTIIVFSVALGIAVDNAIIFLSKYRHELKFRSSDIKESVINALDETGVSIIYTSIVLVLGFAIFIVSGFGGTQALGLLITVTLFVALFFNLVALPSLILSFNKSIVTEAFKEPVIEVYNEDVDTEEENDDNKI
ncbi:MAG: efflux RND transporter permease subunit [Bacteroidales bacterium]|nr:efflux RND transporter permease subunit [Bacteroidales bacterium]